VASIEVDEGSKRAVALAAKMAKVTEGEIVRRLIADSPLEEKAEGQPGPANTGVPIYADYGGHRTRALYFAPGRVEITDGPLRSRSFKSPSGAARAVVRQYHPGVDDNRNGWRFWLLDNGSGRQLQSIRPAEHIVEVAELLDEKTA